MNYNIKENNSNWKGGISTETFNCEICNKRISRKRNKKARHKFCSRVCASKWKSDHGKGKNNPCWRGGASTPNLVCYWCKKEYVGNCTSTRGKHHFCSRKCYGKWKSKYLRDKRKINRCIDCNKILSDLRANQCGDCFKKYYRKHCKKGKDSHGWKDGRSKMKFICDNCGKGFIAAFYSNLKHRFCSMECQGEWKSKYMSGKNSSRWLGGISFEPYAPEFNRTLKRKIKERDNYSCQLCGDYIPKNISNKIRLTAHHVDYNKKNNREDNIITLCNFCNASVNASREQWTEFFKDKMMEV